MGIIEAEASIPPETQWYERERRAHVVQFYQDETPLLNELCKFIGTALASGDAVIVVATNAHRERLAAQLKERGLDLSRAAKQGRYAARDAAETLTKFLVKGRPDGNRFNSLLGSMIAEVRKGMGGGSRVAIFGEMVALLWARGEAKAALELEGLWNDLARTHAFSLRCAYPTNGFGRIGDGEAFLQICEAHTGVIPDETYSKLANEPERLRKIAQLQQAAQAGAELAKLNEDLRQSEERFRLLVEGVKDYAIFMLSPAGKILSWNLGAERIKGYRAEEIIGRHFSTFYTPEDIRGRKPERALKIAAAEGRFEDEGWRVRKDRSRFWANVVLTALFDAAGNLKGFSKVTRDITERKKAEEALSQLSARLLQAQDEERRRLGRELHDSTAQTLSAVSINVALLHEYADFSSNPAASKILTDLHELTKQAAEEIRTFAYLLHPPMLEQAGLQSALRWYVDGFAQRTAIQVDLEIEPGVERLSRDAEIALFRIAQESLTNVYRHSGSPTATVRLVRESGGITLEVSDEGKGFTTNGSGGPEGGLATLGVGISGMRERMRQLGGRLEVKPGKVGITVKAVLPLPSVEGKSKVLRTS